MKLLDRYIATHVLWGTLLALAILAALFSFISFVDDLGLVGKGKYTVFSAIEYLLLTMPRRAFSLFPLAALVGSLVGLGALAGSSELTVMRSSGVSNLRIVAAVMKAAGVLLICALAVGELLTPYCERLAQQRRSLALADQVALTTKTGIWVRDGQSFINIRSVFSGGEMLDLSIFEFDQESELRVATHAGRATYRDGKWLLEDVRQSTIEDTRVVRRTIDKAAWNSLFRPDLVAVIAVRPESLSALGLHRYIGYLRDNALSTPRFELAFWVKIVYPLATGAMIFLAVPMVLGRLRAVGVGQRIVIGTIIGIAFHVLSQTSGHLGIVYGFEPFISATAPTAAFLLAGIMYFRRLR